MSSAEERETIHRALRGDQNAYGKLYRANRERIQATVSQRTKDPDDVDDIVQVSFIRAFTNLRKFRGDSAFSTWLTRIALNVCITHHQTRRITVPESVLDLDPDLAVSVSRRPSPEDELDRRQRMDRILDSIDRLPNRYRDIMRLHYVEDRSYPELREQLNIPTGTLKTWLHRGRKIVKQSVQADVRNA